MADGLRAPVMYDVARLAGVSHQTVSRVLNHSPSVRPQTRDRVLQAMQQLNYRPNALARALASKRSRTVGVISVDTRSHGPASTLLAIERAGREAGYLIILSSLSAPDATSIRSAVDRLAEHSVDGLIVIAPTEAGSAGVGTVSTSVPVVSVEAGRGMGAPVVSVHQFDGARLATEHLLELGHQTVWHVAGPLDWLEAQERLEGWRATLSDHAVPAPAPVQGDWSSASGYRAGLQLADTDGVTAVFAANDQMALGLLHAFHERGIRVPEDVSVVGFDNIPESEFSIPALTTVHQDFDELGRQGLELLVRLMDGAEQQAPPERIVPVLVTRASTVGRPGRPASR